MTRRIALSLMLMHVAVSGCSEPQPAPAQPASAQPGSTSSPIVPAILPEQSGSFETYFFHRPFILSGQAIGLATPFGVRLTESRYDLTLAEFGEKLTAGTPEDVAVQAVRLMRDGDSEGLLQLASDDSHEGNVKFYAGLEKYFEMEPTALFRLNMLGHTCIVFAIGNGKIPGVAVPLKRRGDEHQLFVTAESTSLQQFLFKIVGGVVRFPDAASAIPESSIQTYFRYQHPDASEAVNIFVTNFAGVGEDGELILPRDFAGETKPLKEILDLHGEFWETFASQGLEAAGEKVHPELKLFFVKRAEKRAAEGHHPYDSHFNANEQPKYSLTVKWIAWTDDVWTLGVDVTKKATPDAEPEVWTVIERYVLDPEIGEPRYWTMTGDNLFDALTDEAVQEQVSEYIQSLR